MPDENTETQAPATEAPATETIELGDAGKKAIAAEREARKAAEKLAADASAELKRLQDTLQAAGTETQAAKDEAAKAAVEALRYRIAITNGIPADAIDTLLTGSDEETLTRQAQSILAIAGASSSNTLPPDPTQGAKGNPLSAATTGEKFAQTVEQLLNP